MKGIEKELGSVSSGPNLMMSHPIFLTTYVISSFMGHREYGLIRFGRQLGDHRDPGELEHRNICDIEPYDVIMLDPSFDNTTIM